jgi:cell division protein FtsW
MASRALDLPRRHLRVVREGELARRSSGRVRGAVERSPIPIVMVIVACTALLTAIGLVMVLSASSVSSSLKYGSPFPIFTRQAAYAVVGSLIMLVTANIPFRAWQRLWIPLMAVSGALLLLVLQPGAGTVAGGSARWVAFGPVTIQPSELAKLAVVTFASAVLVRKSKHLRDPLHVALPLLPVLAAVCGLILLQPDLGTTVLIGGIAFIVLFVAGVRFRHLLTGAVVASALGAMLVLSHQYQRARLLGFVNPWKDPMKSGYQVVQSLIGLGSGGLFGVGLGASRQKWMYIPNAHTDFIFSILGEELGLIGALVVLALFGMLIYSGIRVAARTTDPFGRLLAAGITGWLGFQTLVNLGTVTGLLPVTGVPLPFVSFGGSSLVVTLAAVGILVNVGRSGETRPGSRARSNR